MTEEAAAAEEVADKAVTIETPKATEAADISLLETEAPKELDFSLGRPEEFPEEFWDQDGKKVNVNKLFSEFNKKDKIAKDLRAKIGRREYEGKAPEDIADYKVDVAEDLLLLVPDNDPLMQAVRESAKEIGLPAEQFNKLISPVIAKLGKLYSEQGAGQSAEQTEEQANEYRSAEIAKLGPSGHKIKEAVKNYVIQLGADGSFSAEEVEAAKSMINSAASLRVFNKFRMMKGGSNEVPIDMPVDVSASISDIQARMAQSMAEGKEAEYNKYSQMLAQANN